MWDCEKHFFTHSNKEDGTDSSDDNYIISAYGQTTTKTTLPRQTRRFSIYNLAKTENENLKC